MSDLQQQLDGTFAYFIVTMELKNGQAAMWFENSFNNWRTGTITIPELISEVGGGGTLLGIARRD
jgi:hypothetical protein